MIPFPVKPAEAKVHAGFQSQGGICCNALHCTDWVQLCGSRNGFVRLEQPCGEQGSWGAARAASQYPAVGALEQRPLMSKAEAPRHRQGLGRAALAAVWRLWLSAEVWKP